MTYRIIINFLFCLCLFIPGRGETQLTTEVTLTLNGAGRLVNDDSRFNPDNAVQNLDQAEASLEAHLTVSDYLNQRETLRWLVKGYGFYSSATAADDSRLNVMRIDELFADWKGTNLFFSIGKRRINWGHALAFNPVNVIVPPRDPLNPNQAAEGHPVAWLSYSRDAGSVDLFFTRDFDKDWRSDLNRWGARLGFVVGEWDLAGYYFDSEAYQDGDEYERLYGLSLSTNLTDGITFYSEAAGFNHNHRTYYHADGTAERDNQFYVQGVIGSYMLIDPESFLSFFNGDASLLLEVYYNGGGYTPSERRAYYDMLKTTLQQGNPAMLADYRFTGMNQWYGLLTYRNSFKERYTTELTGLIAQDGSFSLQGQMQYNLSDYYSVTAKVTHNQGVRDSEFGNAPISSQIEVALDIIF